MYSGVFITEDNVGSDCLESDILMSSWGIMRDVAAVSGSSFSSLSNLMVLCLIILVLGCSISGDFKKRTERE